MTRILNVGQCRIDGPRLKRFLSTEFNATIDAANTFEEALDHARKHDYTLVLVNRILDADRSPGLDVIAALHDAHPDLPLMLVSDRPDAQEQAVERGALRGFGKSDLDSPTTEALLRNVLSKE